MAVKVYILLNMAVVLVCSIRTVQDSRMCTALMNRRVKHWLLLHVENFSYPNSWYLERKGFPPPLDKVTVHFNLEHATKTYRVIRIKALLFIYLSPRYGCVVKDTPLPLCPRELPGNHCIGDWVVLGACLGGCGKCHPHRDLSQGRPARNVSLY